MKIYRLIMDQSATQSICPFCLQTFSRLENHLKHCKERNGMDYQHLLSQKTLEKKNNKKKKSTCPKCGKAFLRLDTHIQKSATCRNAPTHSTPPTSTEQPHVYIQPKEIPQVTPGHHLHHLVLYLTLVLHPSTLI